MTRRDIPKPEKPRTEDQKRRAGAVFELAAQYPLDASPEVKAKWMKALHKEIERQAPIVKEALVTSRF
jgi:hypothetical protein